MGMSASPETQDAEMQDAPLDREKAAVLIMSAMLANVAFTADGKPCPHELAQDVLDYVDALDVALKASKG